MKTTREKFSFPPSKLVYFLTKDIVSTRGLRGNNLYYKKVLGKSLGCHAQSKRSPSPPPARLIKVLGKILYEKPCEREQVLLSNRGTERSKEQ